MTAARLDGPLVFVDIDTQRDFLDPAGALYVPGSEAILANLARLTDHARNRGIPVIATACAHDENSAELDVFGQHCMIGTPGQQRMFASDPTFTLARGQDWQGGTLPHLTVEKDAYDVFERPETAAIFADFAQNDPTFVVFGVATDYCVKAAVVGLLERGYRVAIAVDAIRAIDPAEEARLLTLFAQDGVLLTLTETVIAAS